MEIIDLRSDTVTRPGEAMRRAIAGAEVGDDVFGNDPTVKRLEALAAGMLGKEAALFTPSATQSNLLALLTHCGRGDEYIVGQEAHTYLLEGGGGAALGGVQPQPLAIEADGTLDLGKVEKLIKPDDYHYARTRLLCLENTSRGRVLPQDYLREARRFVDRRGLRMHLDGARIFNAAVKSGHSAREIASPFDSITLCLSKGLGAPVGALLVGGEDFVREARRWRKMVGGGMRQAGILAAAGIFVLENHIDRLAEDHENALRLARGLAEIPGVEVDPGAVQTNMVFAGFADGRLPDLVEHLREKGVLIDDWNPVRLVTHLDVDAEAIDEVVRVVGEYLPE